MATVVRMPSVLAGATEAVISSWLVKPGDAVTVGTLLAEIETEKALVEYAAEEAGIVGRLVRPEGSSAQVGDPIAVLTAAGDTDADIDAALGPSALGPSAGDPVPTREKRVFASPLVRKLAREQGLSLSGLNGTGPNGRIVRRDLGGIAAEPAPVPDQLGAARGPATAGGSRVSGGTLLPHTPMRRAIARRLTESKATVPHFYLTAECVVDELLALRANVNAASPVKVSVNDFVIAAAAAAFADVPEANVSWTDDGLLRYQSVDIALAVATEAGLVTPVLRDVGSMRLSAIARESAALAQRARERKLLQPEIEGGTFTISNLGMYGTVEFSAIINPPQAGILAVGAARQQPVVKDGAFAVGTVLRCTLSVDHRAIDGALAARWLAALTTRLENPLGAIA